MLEIYPSLIAADLLNLSRSIDRLSSHAAGWHLDVMDNHFVPNLTWGAQFINAIAAYSKLPIWIHLMIEEPAAFVQTIYASHTNVILTFHIETKDNITTILDGIKKKKWQASIAINPKTDVASCFSILDRVSQVLLMSVEPGHSGQISRRNLTTTIAMDGGIDRNNIAQLYQRGIGQFGIASGIFSWPDPLHELIHLYSCADQDE
jgi:ribulose-phosphate 3-epimerase